MSTHTQGAIAVSGLRKSYDHVVLDGISLDIPAGSVLALGTDQLSELDTQPPPEIPATAIALITSTTGPQAESHQRLLELVHERAQRRTQR